MILDGFLLFTGTSNGATGGISSGVNTDVPTNGTTVASNIIDIGVTSGIPSSARGGGARDIGIGDDPSLKLLVQCTTIATGGVSMAASLSGAPDDGTGGVGAYTIMWLGPTVLAADLVVGAQLANVDMPLMIPLQPVPRFLKLSFVTSGTTACEVIGTIVVDRFDQIKGTTGALSGYPAGITVSN